MVEFTRKHTASIHDSLAEMRRIVEQLVAKRDERRDGFVKVIVKAMHERLGADAEEVMKVLVQRGISRTWAKQALQIAEQQGRFTIFSIVDALIRHEHTEYEDLMDELCADAFDRQEREEARHDAREAVRDQINEILRRWEGATAESEIAVFHMNEEDACKHQVTAINSSSIPVYATVRDTATITASVHVE